MTDNAGLKGAAQIAAEQVASTKNVRIKPDIGEKGMIYEFNIPLPDHVRFGSLYLQHNGVWSLGIRAAYELLDPHGSSLGGVVATGYGATVDEARIQALDKLQSQLDVARNRRAPDPVTVQPHARSQPRNTAAFKGKSVEDILATLGVPVKEKPV